MFCVILYMCLVSYCKCFLCPTVNVSFVLLYMCLVSYCKCVLYPNVNVSCVLLYLCLLSYCKCVLRPTVHGSWHVNTNAVTWVTVRDLVLSCDLVLTFVTRSCLGVDYETGIW